MSENNEASSIIDDVSRVVVGKRRALERIVELQKKRAARARTSPKFPSEDPPRDCGNGIAYFCWIWAAAYDIAVARPLVSGRAVIIKKGF